MGDGSELVWVGDTDRRRPQRKGQGDTERESKDMDMGLNMDMEKEACMGLHGLQVPGVIRPMCSFGHCELRMPTWATMHVFLQPPYATRN